MRCLHQKSHAYDLIGRHEHPVHDRARRKGGIGDVSRHGETSPHRLSGELSHVFSRESMELIHGCKAHNRGQQGENIPCGALPILRSLGDLYGSGAGPRLKDCETVGIPEGHSQFKYITPGDSQPHNMIAFSTRQGLAFVEPDTDFPKFHPSERTHTVVGTWENLDHRPAGRWHLGHSFVEGGSPPCGESRICL